MTLGDNLPQKRLAECGSSRFLPWYRTSSGVFKLSERLLSDKR
jgi:hypothetical protein